MASILSVASSDVSSAARIELADVYVRLTGDSQGADIIAFVNGPRFLAALVAAMGLPISLELSKAAEATWAILPPGTLEVGGLVGNQSSLSQSVQPVGGGVNTGLIAGVVVGGICVLLCGGLAYITRSANGRRYLQYLRYRINLKRKTSSASSELRDRAQSITSLDRASAISSVYYLSDDSVRRTEDETSPVTPKAKDTISKVAVVPKVENAENVDQAKIKPVPSAARVSHVSPSCASSRQAAPMTWRW